MIRQNSYEQLKSIHDILDSVHQYFPEMTELISSSQSCQIMVCYAVQCAEKNENTVVLSTV